MQHLLAGQTALQSLITRLASTYPSYRANIDSNFLYADEEFIRFGKYGHNHGRDLCKVSIKARLNPGNGYWIADKDLHFHIKTLLMQPKAQQKLRPARSTSTAFPSQPYFDNSLADREINDTVRISKWGDEIVFEKTTYLDQLASNIFPDETIVYDPGALSPTPSTTFRMLDSDAGGLRPLDQCKQANTVGVACLVADKDWTPILAHRELTQDEKADDRFKELAVMPQGWHCFSSGALCWQDLGDSPEKLDTSTLLSGIMGGMRREILEETGVEPKHYKIVPYAFARELPRAGKPQFFFLIHFPGHAAKEIAQLINENLAIDRHEYGCADMNVTDIIYGVWSGKTRRRRLLRAFPAFNLKSLSRERLLKLAKGLVVDNFTYEAFGSLYLAEELGSRATVE